jgi:cell wall assembly regulator SMI1
MGVLMYGIRTENFDLEKCYLIEHDEVDNPMPKHLVPFSPDGTGNHYCFDLRTSTIESCKVVFWQHDFIYDNETEPEVVNSSFSDWVQEVVIDWTLEEYDYNGNKR